MQRIKEISNLNSKAAFFRPSLSLELETTVRKKACKE